MFYNKWYYIIGIKIFHIFFVLEQFISIYNYEYIYIYNYNNELIKNILMYWTLYWSSYKFTVKFIFSIISTLVSSIAINIYYSYNHYVGI